MNSLPSLLSFRNLFLLLMILGVVLGGAMFSTHFGVEAARSAENRRAVEIAVHQLNRQVLGIESRIASAQRPHVLRHRIGSRLVPPDEANVHWVTEVPDSRPVLTAGRFLVQNPSSGGESRLIP